MNALGFSKDPSIRRRTGYEKSLFYLILFLGVVLLGPADAAIRPRKFQGRREDPGGDPEGARTAAVLAGNGKARHRHRFQGHVLEGLSHHRIRKHRG